MSNIKSNSVLVKAVQDKTGLNKAGAEQAVLATLESIQNLAKANKKITIVGFGSFSVKTRAAREGRNPATGERMTISAKEVFSFKASK